MKYLLLLFLVTNFAQSQSLLVVTENVPPLQIYKDGKLNGGLAVELVQAIFKEANLTPEFQVYPWPRAYHLALTQKNTLIFSITKSPARNSEFIWIGKLYSLQPNITKLKSAIDVNISSPKDINSYKIGVSRGDYGESYLKSIGLRQGDNLYLTVKHENLWKLLYSNRVDAVFTNLVTAKSEIQQAGLDFNKTIIEYKIEGLASDIYLAANRKTDKKIIKQLQRAFQKIKSNGVYQKIINRWEKRFEFN
ncbi:MAG: transporter substrate-binding domain-containing protein [Saccharospirillaceae bacterium]|nr:transporter substrate-binding domain-containing protein [Colwellia sp.]NRB77617.1 transporter substrate-binding domain-containing protein [Saccharospirillaceae bacterium]